MNETAGINPYLYSRIFLSQQTGAGKKPLLAGNHFGPLFQKHHRHALS